MRYATEKYVTGVFFGLFDETGDSAFKIPHIPTILTGCASSEAVMIMKLQI
jgi:hypothetical protein